MSRHPTLRIHADELIVDNFAGGGGASTGIQRALGRSPDIAINHDPEAIALHAANHPDTKHLVGDVWDVDPVGVCRGRRVGLAWFSPDCTHFSKSKGGKPRNKKNRALAWVVIRWARAVKPRVIVLENVEEFEDWGPLDNEGYPVEHQKGLTFRFWLGKLRAAGYEVAWWQLRASDYGAPTSRKRLYLVARSDGGPIVRPKPTHGPGCARPHRTAAECIDWNIDVRTIFGRAKPLAENTLRRIARGVQRFVIDSAEPFIFPTRHAGDTRVYDTKEPFRTITAAHRGELALAAATLIHRGNGEREGQSPRIYDIEQPLGTIVAGGIKHGLVAAFLAKHFGGHEATGSQMAMPIATITARDHHALVATHMLKLHGTCADGQRIDKPMPTIRAQGTHLAEVRSFLLKYYGSSSTPKSTQLPLDTITTKDRFGLVSVKGEDYAIVDIGMRMLVPRELYLGQGFPRDYIIDVDLDGKPLSKEAQVRMCGNSVCPDLADAIVAANVGSAERAAA